MGSSLNLAKTVAIPALISLALYLLLSYLIIPFFRRYHQRYSQYLPLHSLSAQTLSIRERAADALMHFFLPSSWRRRAGLADDPNHDPISIYDEEGETMVGMDMDPARRAALERRRSTTGDSQARLSRDLEEGFMDDSEDDEEERDGNRGRSSQSRR